MGEKIVLIIIGGLIIISSYFLPKLVFNFLKETKMLRANFKGVVIPTSLGVAFLGQALFVYLLMLLLNLLNLSLNSKLISSLLNFSSLFELWLLGVLSFGLLGIMDDFLPSASRGFRGHFKELFYRKKITTGSIKALLGGMVAFIISVRLNMENFLIYILFIDALLIALFTNFINLLDLRPGRALKGFFFFMFILFILGKKELSWIIFLPFILVLLFYLPLDFKGKGMMGDVGSNVLGVTLGIIAVINSSFYLKIILLFFLIFFHLHSEKYSFSNLVENNRVLRFIDGIGIST